MVDDATMGMDGLYLTQEQREEYNAILDEEEQMYWDERLSKYCQLHDAELPCGACAAELEDERRNDL